MIAVFGSGLLHISNISRGHTTSVSDYLAVDDEVKVLVIKSMFPGKISLRYAVFLTSRLQFAEVFVVTVNQRIGLNYH